MPILNGPQLGQVVFAALVHERVFKHPAHPRGIGADDGVDALRQRPAHGAQILNHPRARPVDVGAVLKNHIDERFAEHGFAADELHPGRGDKPRRNRVGDLVFYEVG